MEQPVPSPSQAHLVFFCGLKFQEKCRFILCVFFLFRSLFFFDALELVVADAGKMKAVVGAVLALATSLFVVFWGAPDWSLAAGSSMPNPDGIEGWEWRALWFSQSDATTRHIAFAFRQGHGPPVLLLHGEAVFLNCFGSQSHD